MVCLFTNVIQVPKIKLFVQLEKNNFSYDKLWIKPANASFKETSATVTAGHTLMYYELCDGKNDAKYYFCMNRF